MDKLVITIDTSNSSTLCHLKGQLTRHTVSSAYLKLNPVFTSKTPITMHLDDVSYIDSAGVAFIAHGLKLLGRGEKGITFGAINENAAQMLKLAGWNIEEKHITEETIDEGALEAIGQEFYQFYQQCLKYAHLITEIIYHGIIMPFRGQKMRFSLFMEHLARLGAGSAPIVLTVALLVGLTTAFQAVYQLRKFGANIFIADMVGISMMRELGPLMAAILVAGRNGAAITAEIGTMRVNEEIDALEMFGINPIHYLAVPRIYAVTITQMFLGMLSAITGIIGGFLIARLVLDLNTLTYLNRTIQAVHIEDVTLNIVKSITFGILIVTTGVYYGINVSGGAAGVGKATTNSVVTAIFLIIITDCLFSFL